MSNRFKKNYSASTTSYNLQSSRTNGLGGLSGHASRAYQICARTSLAQVVPFMRSLGMSSLIGMDPSCVQGERHSRNHAVSACAFFMHRITMDWNVQPHNSDRSRTRSCKSFGSLILKIMFFILHHAIGRVFISVCNHR